MKSVTGLLALEMNKIIQEIPYNYYFTHDAIILLTTLDLKKWNGEEAVKGLNKECYDLPNLFDGVSKLWIAVDVTIKLPVTTLKAIIKTENK